MGKSKKTHRLGSGAFRRGRLADWEPEDLRLEIIHPDTASSHLAIYEIMEHVELN
jgi:hypothetical protein